MLQKTVEAHRNGMPVGAMSVERGRQNASCEERDQPHSPSTIPAGRVPYTVRRLYCVSGSCSCVPFVNSPIVELAAVLVLVTPRNSL